MTERSQESLFDRLLKSRYPLTRYLGRQQQFLALLSTAPIPSGTTFTEGETNGIRQRKTPYLSSSKVECYDTPNGMINDQSDNIVQNRSTETVDDARSVSKTLIKKTTFN